MPTSRRKRKRLKEPDFGWITLACALGALTTTWIFEAFAYFSGARPELLSWPVWVFVWFVACSNLILFNLGVLARFPALPWRAGFIVGAVALGAELFGRPSTLIVSIGATATASTPPLRCASSSSKTP